jgi:hypothetical protein
MVEIKELRIGNFVKDKNGKLIVVDSIVTAEGEGINAGILYNGCIPDYYQQDIFPIELSNEFLIKLGFKQDIDEDFIIENGRLALILVEDEQQNWSVRYREDIGMPYMAFNINTPMDYLHQLQNLYYCLTGEDLQYVE